MADKVIDASAFAAITFAEPDRPRLVSLLEGHRLVAPRLLEHEMASICLKKMRAHVEKRDLVLAAYQKALLTPIQFYDVLGNRVVILAEEKGLSTYDASYLLLSAQLGAELVTLDQRLHRAATRAW
jgi:predicted nucleic acid-binding protein